MADINFSDSDREFIFNLKKDELEQLDHIIKISSREYWQKLAMVVARTLLYKNNRVELNENVILLRIHDLIDLNVLECRGNIKDFRKGEVKIKTS